MYKMNSELVQCPLVKTHLVRNTRMGNHLVKCRRQLEESKFYYIFKYLFYYYSEILFLFLIKLN